MVAIRQTSKGLRNLRGGLLSRMEDLRPFWGGAVKEIRAVVRKEFTGRYWLKPDGGTLKWRPVVPFGNRRQGGEPPLVDTGAYFGALMGGAGSVVRIGPRSLVVGVEASRFPYAEWIRGGTGSRVSMKPIAIRPKKVAKNGARKRGRKRWAMFWYLGLTYDVWLTDETLRRGLRLHPRPHMTRSPELSRRLSKLAGGYLQGGAA